MKIYGFWNGGSSYAHHEEPEYLECWKSIQQAKDDLYDRCHEGSSHHEMRYVNRSHEHFATPGVDESSETVIYWTRVDQGRVVHIPEGERFRIKFGAEGGIYRVWS